VSPSEFARVLRAAADECDRLEAERRSEHRDWVDQSASPLGSRRHIARVRARLAAGRDGAARVGRRHLLSPSALAEELSALSKVPARAPTLGDELRAELRLVRGRE
jgi:hypothetical protein